jgi:hypothetical protein
MMAKQLLFYETAVPVNLARHRDLCVERITYQFAASVNSVPLTAVEIPRAAREYTIVFAGDDAVTPFAVVGVQGNENVYVSEDGTWNADYVPAFVRRYPFVFSRSEDEKRFTLCIDESWDGCNQEGRGERLFDENGERTSYLSQMLSFLEQYQAHFNRTQAYCRNLKELDLLEPMKADFTLPDGTKKSLVGFMAVNRDKLKALPTEKLAELVKSDELELTYNHLLSMNNFALMINRVSARSPVASGSSDNVDSP